MTRLGVVAYAVFGAMVGYLWGFITTGEVAGMLAGAFIGFVLNGLIARSWMLRNFPS